MEVKKMQKIAVSEQDFGEIRKQSSLYVDKTKKIYELFKNGKYFFLSRPRRFGKSMLCSTLRELFLGNRELFKGLWIDSSDWEWIKHPVIHIDMTAAAGATKSFDEVKDGLRTQLDNIAEDYEINVGNPLTLDTYFGAIIRALNKKTGVGVAVIIDEYDKPLLDVFDKPQELAQNHALLRSFYGQLKSLSPYLRFVFLTGVYKFSQTSVFSALNNLEDISFHPSSAHICGFTQEELVENFMPQIEALATKAKKAIPEFLDFLKERYNGYTFCFDNITGELGTKVYNPFAINNVLNAQSLGDFWFASGSPALLIEKLQTGNYAPFDPENAWLVFRELISSATPENLTLNTLIYYAGYVTIKEYDPDLKKVLIGYPNMEVAEAMAQYLVPLMTEKATTGIQHAAEDIATILRRAEGFENLREHINRALSHVPYHLFSKAEGYYHTILLFLLHMQGLPAIAEDISNRGRADISVVMPKGVYIFEIKVDDPASTAIAQIEKKGYATKYRSLNKPIYAFGISIGSTEKEIIDFEMKLI